MNLHFEGEYLNNKNSIAKQLNGAEEREAEQCTIQQIELFIQTQVKKTYKIAFGFL